MTRVQWGAPGTRRFEAGVDRGVLYVNGDYGVPWSGLTAVSESPSGGDIKQHFLDGYNFRNVSAKERFQATIEAFYSPRAFDACDGVAALGNGLFATQQPRKPFHLTYRSKIGNDLVGADHGYKIHLVYNAMASPASKSHKSLSADAETEPLSWNVVTKPVRVDGVAPTAHFIIDSTETPKLLMTMLEDMLYGSDAGPPRMPAISEVIQLFQSEGFIVDINRILNPTFGLDWGWVSARASRELDPMVQLSGQTSMKLTVTDDSAISYLIGDVGTWMIPVNGGAKETLRAMLQSPIAGNATLQIYEYDSTKTLISPVQTSGAIFEVEPGEGVWNRLQHEFTYKPTTAFIRPVIMPPPGLAVGDSYWVDEVSLGSKDPYFDGDKPDESGRYYSWVGQAYASMSVVRSWVGTPVPGTPLPTAGG